MADDVQILTPAGVAPIATDEIGGKHFQRFKPAFGVDGEATDVSRDNPLPVTTASRIVDVTLSLNTSGAYASGDVLADTQVVTNALRIVNGNGLLNSIVVIDEDDQNQPFDLVFLSANVSIGTENDAVAVSDANARQVLGIVHVLAADYVDFGGVGVATLTGLVLGLQAASGTSDLYVAAITRGTPTHSAAGIRLRLNIITD